MFALRFRWVFTAGIDAMKTEQTGYATLDTAYAIHDVDSSQIQHI